MEAALIFPLILMVLLFLVTMSKFLLMEVLTQSTLSREVLKESMALSCTGKIDEKESISIIEQQKGLFDGITGDDDISLINKRYFKNRGASYFHDFKYVINEMEYIRWIDQSSIKEQP